uniref:Transposase n=1 Tax=Steinernema glaseri TaxID=37863 RepID=A0A1I7YUK6_9BILA
MSPIMRILNLATRYVIRKESHTGKGLIGRGLGQLGQIINRHLFSTKFETLRLVLVLGTFDVVTNKLGRWRSLANSEEKYIKTQVNPHLG